MTEITRLLARLDTDAPARSVLSDAFAAAYDELLSIARRQMIGERRDHTLDPAGLVNELFIRVSAGADVSARSRRQFLALSAKAMRRLLVDHARGKGRRKRGGNVTHVSLSSIGGTPPGDVCDAIALEDALAELGRLSPRQARVVELIGLGGLRAADAAELLGVTSRTIERDWARAREFLSERLGEPTEGDRDDEAAGEPTPSRGRIPGARSGSYVLVERLGAGGAGEVWLATGHESGRRVALKFLDEPRARSARRRLAREARVLASLDHPAIARVLALEVSDPEPRLVVEYVEGRTLRAVLDAGLMSLERALAVGHDVALALAEAHARGLVHRDLKPSNVVVTPAGTAKVLDFGIAQLGGESALPVGTPGYVSPEARRGDEIDTRADVWSLGVVLFECLTGSRWADVTGQGPARPPWPASLDGVPAVTDMIDRALDEDPSNRPRSADACRRILSEALALARQPPGTGADAGVPPMDPAVDGARTPTRGRAHEIAMVSALLVTHRCVALVGPGGVGKTRVALEVARAVHGDRSVAPGGSVVVDLAGARDRSDVLLRVARALAVGEGRDRSLEGAVRDAIEATGRLVVLDQADALLEDVARLVTDLADGPRARLLVTSRAPLDSATTVRVRALPVPPPGGDAATLARSPAIALFLDVASRDASGAEPARSPDDGSVLDPADPVELAEVAEVCRRVGGFPLAIELAAAARSRVQAALHTLAPPDAEDAVTRAIAWSLDRLSAGARCLVSRMPIFASPAGADALVRVCADDALPPERLMPALLELCDMALVDAVPASGRNEPSPDASGLRYRVVARVADAVRTSTPDAALVERHRAVVVDLVSRAADGVRGPEQAAWLSRIDEALPDVVVAMERALADDPVVALRVATWMGQYWHVRGLWSEGRRRLSEAIAAVPDDAAPTVLGNALNWEGNLALDQGDVDAAAARYRACIARGRRLDDELLVARAMGNLGVVHIFAGRHDEARRAFETTLAMHREAGRDGEVATSLLNLGVVAERERDYATAERHYLESLELRRHLGDRVAEANSLNNLGTVAERLGDLDRAWQYHEEALSVRRTLDDRRGTAETHHNLGAIAFARGDRDAARAHLFESLRQRRDIGDTVGEADTLEAVAELLADSHPRLAARFLGAADARRDRVGLPPATSAAQRRQRVADLLAGRLDEARFARLRAGGRRA